ncbi:hypothetical protein F8M41_024066 [Gigaspora margarita]|uniref:Uncharacterized protein n=1 Tax=Gigaspora margarita TaxID=4874 RepID=A0A8H4ACC9_GIGMA|nr:hypothetical protein F8M41_024066 [Gigaspora margarita]
MLISLTLCVNNFSSEEERKALANAFLQEFYANLDVICKSTTRLRSSQATSALMVETFKSLQLVRIADFGCSQMPPSMVNKIPDWLKKNIVFISLIKKPGVEFKNLHFAQ